MESNSILEIIMGYTTNEGMEPIILNDEKYIEIQKEIDESQKDLDSLNLSQEQKMAVDDLTASYVASGVRHARLAYKKGFKDCAAFLKEIGAI